MTFNLCVCSWKRYSECYGCKARLFDGKLFWVGHCDPLHTPLSQTFILEEELIQY